ncbi:hypothetical protein HH800_05555 [Sphingobium yanoikuyae]|uniref:Uncharacterized protein n=1 Tax=Sphingobium yanoikuyae TaxID=13690 RepID=A0A6M4G512_SPHYA|nr:hypothetical protein [Sphingobium yanoikuyae]QJR01704.1 hypothetical protein HH800_05555 [Sphingobium yanoikuyae]
MTKPNEPEGLQERVARELCRQAGYDPDGAARNGWGWRNYMDAAAQIVAIFPAHPVADAGGVTDADREAAAKCVEHGLSRPNPLNVRQGVVDSWHLIQAFARHRLQSVAAATAAKDAEIDQYEKELSHAEYCIEHYKGRGERLREALTYFANRPTVAEVIEGKHDPMPDTVEARIEEMGRRKREHDEAILQARAALSEAREAGAKD